MEVKFMWNGLKVDGKLYKAWFNKGGYTKESGICKETITIYAKDYISFPRVEGLKVKNNSDLMTDYFEKDKIRVGTENKFYSEVLKAWEKQAEHNKKKLEKRYGA